MQPINKYYKHTMYACLVFFASLQSCQKMERPSFGKLIPDPTPPPYTALKSFWAFEDNLTDAGENKFTSTFAGITYVPGITGKAIKIDYSSSGGYVLAKTFDTLLAQNEFVSIPGDTIKNIGSFTIAFWINVAGPVQNGAQGIFSVSNKTEFWGNFDLFFENWSNAGDATEAFLKIHMFNFDFAPPANGEQWNELKIPAVLNKWTHLAITYNAATSKISLYKDGAPSALYNKTLGGGNYGKVKWKDVNGVVIGNHQFQTTPSLTTHGPESWAKPVNGSMDQVRIYNKALTDAEALNLFTNKL